MTLVVGDARFATGYVEGYLERHPALASQLREAGAHVVVFDAPHMFDESPAYFDHMQTALATASATYGRGLYVAVVAARAVLHAGVTLPAVDARPGVFVGYFAVGEGGAVFVRPNGDLGADPALFAEAISGMMRGDR